MNLPLTLTLRRICALVCVASLLPVLGECALVWQTRLIELTTKPSDKDAIGSFHFENSGPSTVTITSVQPSCGCTTANLDKRAYAPGERGEIKAVFTLGDRVGEQEKTIYVTTDDASAHPVPLVLHVTIPEFLSYSPRLLMWNVGEESKDKFITLIPTAQLQITTIKLVSRASSEVVARIESVDGGLKYRLLAHPVSTATVMNEPIAGVATFADGATQPFKIYLLVR